MNGACALCCYAGFHARSLNWQRPKQARARASDGQPENLVGRIAETDTTFKHSRMGRGASPAAFPRGAWERSNTMSVSSSTALDVPAPSEG